MKICCLKLCIKQNTFIQKFYKVRGSPLDLYLLFEIESTEEIILFLSTDQVFTQETR